jgi:hypothetical protein
MATRSRRPGGRSRIAPGASSPTETGRGTTDAWRAWAKENLAEWDKVEDIERELGRMPLCPTCGENDMVEDAVSPEEFDGYCYRCKAPFKRTPEKPVEGRVQSKEKGSE